MSKIVIFGGSGYIGSKMADYFGQQGWEVVIKRVDVTDLSAIREFLKKEKPDVALNATGKKGSPNVDWCEDHPVEVYAVNTGGALNIALAAHELGIFHAHFGTGCLYMGDNDGHGFAETDEPNFTGSLYSRSKIAMEKAILDLDPLILRVRIPIDSQPSASNLIDKLVKYGTVFSIPNSCSIIDDLVRASFEAIDRRLTGLLNMTNIGSLTHDFLLKKYQEIVDPNFKFQVNPVEELYTSGRARAERSNTILNVEKREQLGIHMPNIQERIVDVLQEYKQNLKK